jgi:hypothetical protein
MAGDNNRMLSPRDTQLHRRTLLGANGSHCFPSTLLPTSRVPSVLRGFSFPYSYAPSTHTTPPLTNPRPELRVERRCSDGLWLLLLRVKVGWGTRKGTGNWTVWLCSRGNSSIINTPLVPRSSYIVFRLIYITYIQSVPHSKHTPSRLYKPVS